MHNKVVGALLPFYFDLATIEKLNCSAKRGVISFREGLSTAVDLVGRYHKEIL